MGLKYFFTVLILISSKLFSQEFNCFDGIDNDGDGAIDISDVDCSCYAFQFVGSASQIGNPPTGNTSQYCFEITPNQNTQNGAIWLSNKVDLDDNFNFSAEIYAGNNNGGADGFTIVFQNDPNGIAALGIPGGGLGYGGISPSIAFEIDTYDNGTGQGDVSQDHIAINLNGDPTVPVGTPSHTILPNIEDGNYHTVVINWDTNAEELTFSLDGNTTSYNADIINTVFGGQNLVYFGFTGSTGGATNQQIVCITDLQAEDPGETAIVNLCTGTPNTFNLFDQLGGSPDSSGTWTDPLGNPFGTSHLGLFDFASDLLGTYTYTVSNFSTCANPFATVEVIDNIEPNAGTGGSITICDDSNVVIDLHNLITGEDSGGTWTRTSGIGGTFDATSATFDPESGATTSTFEYTITGNAGCPEDITTATIIINPAVSAGTDSIVLICDNSQILINLFDLITGEDSGGNWIRTSGVGGTFDALNGTFLPEVGLSTSTFEYTIAGSAPCNSDTSNVTINVASNPPVDNLPDVTLCGTEFILPVLASGSYFTGPNGTGTALNAGDSITSSQTVFIYAESGTSPNCVNESSFNITIELAPIANPIPNLEQCDELGNGFGIFDLSTYETILIGGQTGIVVSYHNSFTDAVNDNAPISDSTNYNSTGISETIWVRLEKGALGCYDITSFELILIGSLNVNSPSPLDFCDDDNDGVGVFDLASIPATVSTDPSLVITIHLTQDEANLGTNPIDTSTPFINSSNQNPQILYISVVDPSSGCSTLLNLQLNVLDGPELPAVLDDVVICDSDQDGFAVFDLTSAEANIFSNPDLVGLPSDYSVTYHETSADATAGLPLIASPTAYTNQTAYFDTIWVRVVSNSSNCAAIRPLNLVVNDAPIDVAQVATPLIICDDLGLVNDGFSIFDLSLKDAEIAQGNSNVTISYYPSPADAAAGTNQITDPTAYPNISNAQTLGVVVTDNSTGCQAFTILTIEVKPNPTPYPNAIDPLTACDGDQDGSALFDLTSYDGLILSTDAASDITGYFTSYDDAVNDVNDINDTGDPANFVNTSNPQTIWVRVENALTGCFELVSFDLYNPLPLVNLTADKTILCIDATGVAIPGSEPILDTGLDPALYTFVWDVDGNILPDTGASITASVPGTYTVTVSNANGDGCFNTASITITTSSAPLTYSANVTSVAFAENHTIEATASGNSTYVFSLDGGPFQDSGVFENVAPGLHYVTIRDVNGCGEIVLEVCVIDYPKYFTPNADTYHDTWNITGGTCGNITKLYIFDRYGKLLKQLDPNGAGWDGTYNGTLLPSTDYWFKLSYIEDGVEKEFASHFAMKR